MKTTLELIVESYRGYTSKANEYHIKRDYEEYRAQLLKAEALREMAKTMGYSNKIFMNEVMSQNRGGSRI